MQTRLAGPLLSVETCARRLAPYGIRPVSRPGQGLSLGWPVGPEPFEGGDVDCEISWWGPGRPHGEPGSEAMVQAATGLMHLHGRDLGGPRRIGIEIASVAAGMLAAQALLAVAVGRCRGVEVRAVRTSVLQAGLLQASHYFAAATCPPEDLPVPAPAPGPPFATADGRWFEIETFDTEAWKAFWLRLGAPVAELGPAWTRFRPRYYRGTSSLPHGFHEATASHTLDEATVAARACGVSLSPVRGYDEVMTDSPAATGFPVVSRLLPDDAGPGTFHQAGAAKRHELPLTGVRVVEATSRLQGPLAGLLLQMLGASVTRIETPGGDAGRSVPPLADDTGSFFLCFNRGKDTVELDLGRDSGRRELAERGAEADVFLHNWRPGKASEWGLAAEDLARANPQLVYAEASGWSARSGAERLIGTDFLVQAWTGLANALDPAPEPPRPSRVLLTDFMGALVTCEGALAGLYRREMDGRGYRVATSLEAGAMALQAHVVEGMAAGSGGQDGRPQWGALDGPVAASDGSLVIRADEAADLSRLCALCEVDSLNRSRCALENEVVKRLADSSVAELAEQLEVAGVASEPVMTDLAAVAGDRRLATLFEPLAGTCVAPASPWLLEP